MPESKSRIIDCSTVKPDTFTVPNVTVQELRNVIPPHCFRSSTTKSFFYVLRNVFAIAAIYTVTLLVDVCIDPSFISLPHPLAYSVSRFWVWAVYGFWTSVFAGALWIIAHDCAHQAFSESKLVCDITGLIIHTALGVPHFAWRISHAQHHRFTGHMGKDNFHVPATRSSLGLPPADSSEDDLLGSKVPNDAKTIIWEALGESPIATTYRCIVYAILGWPLYLCMNFLGPANYPKGTNHFNPNAIIFTPQQYWQVVWSNLAMVFWAAGLSIWASKRGIWEVLTVYGVPYLWLNHLIAITTLLQHTDPRLPRFRDPGFTFVRGALSTFDRPVLGDWDSCIARISTYVTHGILENHVVHHVCSKIPHYHAWAASAELRKFLHSRGIQSEGAPASWGEVFRILRECRFVEDEGDIVFYKNAHGIAQMRPVWGNGSINSDNA
ncbi:hypothetical protein NP233_g449 [Leucocoprinus birnbaumii]|uniref:Fatty acid desaturase domain-containing protein n=1 Tax=Leucocoprinus birnbaumii TaxID=56174 RepID=A0AAD5Z096_9AGAR|nr:hypothetical protein NP233_g449 [Leucocoprinus birnbaumii]